MFSIVEMSDGVVAIPTKWITKDKKSCYYPSDTDNALEFIKKKKDYDEDWPRLSVFKIFSSAKTYKEAEQLVEIAVNTSDNDECNLKKTRRFRKRKVFSSDDENHARKKRNTTVENSKDSDNDESDDNDLHATKRMQHQKQNIGQINVTEEENSESEVESRSHSKVAGMGGTETPSTENMSLQELVQYSIEISKANLKKSSRILLEVNEIKKGMKEGDLHVGSNDALSKTAKFTLPLETMHDFDVFENKLKTDLKTKQDLVEVLSRRGGKEYNDLTSNILYRAICDQVASQFSYVGRQKKKAFRDTELCKCIISAVQMMFSKSTEHDIEKHIGAWLAQATYRQSRKLEKEKRREKENTSFNEGNDDEDPLLL